MEDKPPKTSELLALLWPYFKPDAGLIGVGAVALLVSSLSNAAAPTILRAVIDGSSKSISSSGSGSGTSGALLASERAMLLKALGVFTVGALGSWLRTKSLGCVSARVGRRLRRQLFAALLKKPAAFFDFKAEQGGLSSADADTRLGRDVDTCTKAITSNLGNVLRYSSSVCSGTFMVARVGSVRANLSFACLGAGLVLVVVVPSLMAKKKLDKSRKEHDALRLEASEFVLEKLGGVRTVMCFSRQDYEAQSFQAMAEAVAGAEERVAKAEAMFMGTLDLGVKASAVAIAAYGSALVRQGHLSAGQLTSFTMYSGLAGMGLAGLLRAGATDWQSPAWRLLCLAQAADKAAAGGAEGGGADNASSLSTTTARSQGHLQFQGVHFAYPAHANGGSQGPEVLSGVDLEVKAGEVLLVCGPSGCGKSTLGRLLLGLYTPTKGEILLDGTPLSNLDCAWVRSQIGVVEQEAALWSASVRDNIRYGRLDASDDDIIAAAEAANAHGFIMQLPQGYDTVLSKGGQSLSGGQRQRLAIARALVKSPSILLLDEATAALDPSCEAAVLDALAKAMKGRTCIAVAHHEEAYRAVFAQQSGGKDGGAALECARTVTLGVPPGSTHTGSSVLTYSK